jgi:membrane peptidoglycan carboxypeptidase
VLWEASPRRERIAPEDAVYKLTTVLSSDEARASMFGYDSPLNLPIPAAVKSGSSDETRDAWTIGYTPGLVAGVWVGNANNDPIPGGTSTYTAAPIWRTFMLSALEGQPVLSFLAPGEEAAAEAQPTSPPQPQQQAPQPTAPMPTAPPLPTDTPAPQPSPTQVIVTPTAQPQPSVQPGPGSPQQPGNGNGDDDDDNNGGPGNQGGGFGNGGSGLGNGNGNQND